MAALLGAGAAGQPAPASAVSDPHATPSLTVEIIEEGVPVIPPVTPLPSPPPSAPSAPPASPAPTSPSAPGGAPSPAGSGALTQATIPDRDEADAALGSDVDVIGGILALGGLTIAAAPDIAIGNGHVTLDIVVRNLTTRPIDASARFRVANIFGSTIAELTDIAVDALAVDETRRIQVRVDSPGQQIVLRGSATLTLAEPLPGSGAVSFTRNATAVVVPWFSLALTVGLGILGAVAWFTLLRRGAAIFGVGR